MRKKAFTLAEVLVTLTIIGIIAAMTIPTLLNRTTGDEYRSALKKAISAINQSLTLSYANSGVNAYSYSTAEDLYSNIFNKEMNVSKTTAGEGFAKTADFVFYTTDGVMYGIKGSKKAGCDEEGQKPCFDMIIDVNGDKKPNEETTDADFPKDGYYATMYAQRVVPKGEVTQKVIYGQGIYYD